MRTKYILLAAVAAVGIGDALPAFAQDKREEAFVDNGDIVVTARKREESIMKVPVVANTISSEQVERTQTTDIRRVADQIPGFIVGEPSSAAYGAQLSLRGIGTSVLNGTIDQSISLNLDNQIFTQGLAFTAGMFDLQSITVLKGPQALFFGKASPGGVVVIQTANPGPDFELIARAGYEAEADTKQGELIVSAPLTSTLGVRLAGRYSRSLGYFRNIAPAPTAGRGGIPSVPRRSNNYEEVLLRGTLLWEPTDKFSARLKVTYSNNKTYGRSGQLGSCPDGTAGNGGIQYVAANEDCKIDRNFTMVDMDPANFSGIAHDGHQFAFVEQTFGVLELNYNFSDQIKGTSVTGYYDVNDTDQFAAAQSGAAASPYSSATIYNREDFTQELRLASDFTDIPVNFTLGAFYQHVKQHKLGIARYNTTQRPAAVTSPFLSLGTHDNPNESESLFGQLLWKITPQLELAGGARWTHEDREHVYYNLLVSSTVPIALAVPRIRSNRVSPEVTLTWTPTDDFTLYGALKKGYKSGSHNSSGSFSNGSDSSFGDEQVEGGELGLKARLADRALSFNLSGYYYKYKGLQVGANGQISDGVITTRTLNAASAKVYGLDADLTYRPPSIEGLTLRLAANYNHARYGRFDNAPCWGGQRVQDGCSFAFNRSAASQQTVAGPAGGVFVPANQATSPGGVTVNGTYGFWGFYTSQDLSGRELLRSPDFTLTGNVDYEMPVGKNMRLALGGNLRYSSSYYSDILVREDERQPAFAKIGANITLYGPDDRWELSLIGNNLTDHLVRNKCSLSNSVNGVNPFLVTPLKGGTIRNAAGVDEVICTVDSGRELWVRATFRL